MPDPFTLAVTGYVAANAPRWLDDLRGTLLDKGKALASEKGQARLGEKEQQRQLQMVLQKAVARGLKKFRKTERRDQYKAILTNLFEPGEHSAALRRAAITAFSLSDGPDLSELNSIYNQSLRSRSLAQSIAPAAVDAAPA